MGNNIKRSSKLSSLYPKPKSYTELDAERKRIKAKKIARQPKHIELQIALRLSLVLAYLLCSVTIIPTIIYWGIAGVCACFLLGIALCGILPLTKSSIERLVEMKESNSTPLFTAYIASALPLITVGIMYRGQSLLLLEIIIINFLLSWLIAATVFSTRIANFSKILILLLLFLCAVASSVLAIIL